MTIIVDVKSILPGNNGISKYFKKILIFWILNKKNDIFYLVYPDTQEKFDFPEFSNVFHKKLKFKYFHFNLFNIIIYNFFTFRNYSKKIYPDLIFTPYHDILLPKSIKSIITVHDLCFYKLKNLYNYKTRIFYNYILKKNINRSSHILTVSNATKLDIIKYFNIDVGKISIIPNSFEIPNHEITYSKLVSSNKFNIFYNGGVEKRKNLTMLFRLIKYYKKTNINIQFYLTGNKNDYIEYIFEELNNVIFLGKLEEEELTTYFLDIDLLIYPSIYEGFGRPVVESIIYCKPVVCYDLELYREYNHPYIFYFKTFNQLISNVNYVFSNYKTFNKNHYSLNTNFLTISCNSKFVEMINSFNLK